MSAGIASGPARGASATTSAPAGSTLDRAAPFAIGRDYTRAAIHAAVGGSRRACLPTRDGVVVAACLLRTLNPDTPRVMLCGTGPSNGAAGALLAAQETPVPFFTRIAANRWQHEGFFRVAEVVVDGPRYRGFVERSGRVPESVSRVLLLRPA